MKNRKYCKDKFVLVGIATDPKGRTKVRFGNDMSQRTKSMQKAGFTDIQFYELPGSMSKAEATAWLYKNYTGDDFKEVVRLAYEKYNVVTAKSKTAKIKTNHGKDETSVPENEDSKEKETA